MLGVTVSVDSRCKTVRIFRLAQVVNRTGESGSIFMRMIHLIMDAPHIDGRMVEALTDQLTHLLVRIVPFLTRHTVHERYLCPDDQPQRVAARIDIVRLLIMRKAYRCGADIHDGSQIEVMLLVSQRTSKPPPVLMARHSIHRILLSVEEEAFSCHDFILAKSQRLNHFVKHTSVAGKPRHHLIKIRVLSSVPQVRPVHLESRSITLHALRRKLERLHVTFHQFSLGIINGILKFHRNRSQRSIVHLHLHGHLRRLFRHVLLRNVHAGRSAVVYGNGARFGRHQPHRTVNAAIHAKQIMIHRNHIRTRRIVRLHHDFVFLSPLDLRSKLTHESRIASLMRSGQITIDIYLGTRAYPLKAKINPLLFHRLREGETLAVIPLSLIKRSHLALHVLCVPRMGKRDLLPLPVPFHDGLQRIPRKRSFLELPPVVKRNHFAGRNMLKRTQKQSDQTQKQNILSHRLNQTKVISIIQTIFYTRNQPSGMRPRHKTQSSHGSPF